MISNGKSPFQEHNFFALGLQEYFSTIVISEAVDLRKPNPQIFLYACKQLSCTPSECIFIGDNLDADIIGAKNVGMKTIYFHPFNKTEIEVADAHIRHYKDLETAIRHIWQSRD